MASRKKSEKPQVIERIFDQLWDPATSTLKRTVVTGRDVVEAIQWSNANRATALSDRNPANFFKDVIRGSGSNQMWPDRLKTLGWTAYQTTGGGNILEFIPYKPGQTEPFPDPFGYHPAVKHHRIQSLSMPVASKALGRNDETYLIQVAVKLSVVETHFALQSPLEVTELTHLQMGVKLRKTEIDSLFAGRLVDADGQEKLVIITAEAKTKGQRILHEQIIAQVRAAFEVVPTVQMVVPVVLVARPPGIYFAEFRMIRRSELSSFVELILESEAFYELTPRVQGI